MKLFIKRLLAFLLFLIIINIIFTFFYEKPLREAIKNGTHSTYLKYNDINNPEKNYEMVFMGSSRGISTYNPFIFDSILDTKSYNMCTGSQNTVETYYILRNILLSQKPKYIIYEMYEPSFNNRDDYYLILDNAMFFKSFLLKNEMIINGFGINGIIPYMIPIIKHKLYIKNDISEFLFRNKKNKIINDNWISGFYYDNNIVDSVSISNFREIESFDHISISEKKELYFNKIVDLCEENDIELICVRAPYPPSRIRKSISVDNASIFFKKICKENNIPYYNFNAMYNEKFPYLDTDFSDTHHINSYGAKKISNQLSIIIKEKHLK